MKDTNSKFNSLHEEQVVGGSNSLVHVSVDSSVGRAKENTNVSRLDTDSNFSTYKANLCVASSNLAPRLSEIVKKTVTAN